MSFGARGAEFGEVQPLVRRGGPIAVQPNLVLPSASYGSGTAINTARIRQVTPTNSFRLGQQVFFWLGVVPPQVGNVYAQRVRLKLWWLRPNKEFRAPGDPQWLEIDRATFGNGPVVVNPMENNRYVWIPSPKRLDITPYGTAPPPVTPLPNSDSVLLDDCLVMDLPDPTDPAEIANFPAPQVVSRWDAFLYPAMGYALGMTYDATTSTGVSIGAGPLLISLTWSVGTLGGSNYQESIG